MPGTLWSNNLMACWTTTAIQDPLLGAGAQSGGGGSLGSALQELEGWRMPGNGGKALIKNT